MNKVLAVTYDCLRRDCLVSEESVTLEHINRDIIPQDAIDNARLIYFDGVLSLRILKNVFGIIGHVSRDELMDHIRRAETETHEMITLRKADLLELMRLISLEQLAQADSPKVSDAFFRVSYMVLESVE